MTRKEQLSQAELLIKLKTEIRNEQSGIKLVPLTQGFLMTNYESLISQWEKFFSDKEVTKHLHPLTPFKKLGDGSEVKILVEEFLATKSSSSDSILFIIYHPDSTLPIGHLSLNGINSQSGSASRGIVIGEADFRYKGIGKIVGQMSIEHARKSGLKILKASAHSGNSASIANLTRQFGTGSLSTDQKEINFTLDLTS